VSASSGTSMAGQAGSASTWSPTNCGGASTPIQPGPSPRYRSRPPRQARRNRAPSQHRPPHRTRSPRILRSRFPPVHTRPRRSPPGRPRPATHPAIRRRQPG